MTGHTTFSFRVNRRLMGADVGEHPLRPASLLFRLGVGLNEKNYTIEVLAAASDTIEKKRLRSFMETGDPQKIIGEIQDDHSSR